MEVRDLVEDVLEQLELIKSCASVNVRYRWAKEAVRESYGCGHLSWCIRELMHTYRPAIGRILKGLAEVGPRVMEQLPQRYGFQALPSIVISEAVVEQLQPVGEPEYDLVVNLLQQTAKW
jgi:hypothetical protein